MPPCRVEWCTLPRVARHQEAYCRSHSNFLKNYPGSAADKWVPPAMRDVIPFDVSQARKSRPPRICATLGCEEPARIGLWGHCMKHSEIEASRMARRDPSDPIGACAVPLCGNASILSGLMCTSHAARSARYGLGTERALTLFSQTACDGCGGSGARVLSIDHNHACCPGIGSCGDCVRGMLCFHCNVALGKVGDSIERLFGLIAYLRNAPPLKAA